MRKILWLFLAFLLVGCASIPTTGPVERVGPVDDPVVSGGINVTARPPVEGASIEAILEGFLSACESGDEDYAIARMYLTPEAAQSWHPELGITIYDSLPSSRVITVTQDGTATLEANVIGRLDDAHRYTSVKVDNFTHNFHMTLVDGEWRIASPGAEVLMSRSRFQRTFQALPIYFLDAQASSLVPEEVFLRRRELTPDTVVKTLLNGPSQWMRPVVTTALPAEVTSSGTYIEGGVAHVSLNEAVESLSSHQRFLAAAQLFASLQYFDAPVGITLSAQQRPLSIENAGADGVVRARDLRALGIERDVTTRYLYGISGKRIVRTSDTPNSQVLPVSGIFSQELDSSPRDLAVTWTGDRIAWVSSNGRSISWAATWGGDSEQVYEGNDIVSVQFDALSRLWFVDNTPSGPVIVRMSPDRVSVSQGLDINDDDAKVVDWALSPDSARIAVIASTGDKQRVGELRLKSDTSITVDGWRDIPLNHGSRPLTRMRDLTFTSSLRLMLIGAVDDADFYSVFSMDIDGAEVRSQGPLTDLDPTHITAISSNGVNAVAISTSKGIVYRYEAQFRWSELTTEMSTIAYPS